MCIFYEPLEWQNGFNHDFIIWKSDDPTFKQRMDDIGGHEIIYGEDGDVYIHTTFITYELAAIRHTCRNLLIITVNWPPIHLLNMARVLVVVQQSQTLASLCVDSLTKMIRNEEAINRVRRRIL